MFASTLQSKAATMKEMARLMMPPKLLRKVFAAPLAMPPIANKATMTMRTMDNQSIVKVPG